MTALISSPCGLRRKVALIFAPVRSEILPPRPFKKRKAKWWSRSATFLWAFED
jgi:hypothetical protein